MKHNYLKYLVIPAISVFLFSCTTNQNTSSSVPTSEQSTSTTIPTSEPTSVPTTSTTTTVPGPTSTSEEDDYYKECKGLSGSALAAKLLEINPAKDPSYAWYRYEQADEAEDDSSSILCLYTRHNIPKSNHVSSDYAWDKWNREHIWTQTAYPTSDKDNHNIFACEGKINQIRSDDIFAEGGSPVSVFGHDTGCKSGKGTFEPNDAAKGEVARSIMYGAVMYERNLTWIIDSVELALKWHIEHEVSSREIRRNEVVFGNQGNRNPFVDHPSYACRIWGETNSTTRQLCGIN